MTGWCWCGTVSDEAVQLMSYLMAHPDLLETPRAGIEGRGTVDIEEQHIRVGQEDVLGIVAAMGIPIDGS